MQHWNLKTESVLWYCAEVAVTRKRFRVTWPTLGLLLIWALFPARLAFAQPNAESQELPSDSIGVVRKAPTEIVLLRDKNGNLVKVATNLSLEEYLRIYNQQNDVEDQNTPPAFVIDQAIYSGRASSTHLNFSVDFRIQLVQADEDQWVQVPLHLPQCVMKSAPKYSGTGEFFVTWDSQLGHVVWLKGAVNSQHGLTLSLTRPLRTTGQLTELILTPPPARSQFRQLVVPIGKARSIGGDLEVKTTSPSNSTTAFAFDFQSEELVMGWSDAGGDPGTELTRIQAEVNTEFTVRQNRRVSARGTLKVEGLGSAVSNFDVLLPVGMKLLEIPNSAYRVTRLPAVAQEGESETRERIRVSVLQPQSTLSVVVEAETPNSPASEVPSNQSFAGFEVVDAVKQSGSLRISTTTNWDVVWQVSGDIRRALRITEESAGSAGIRLVAFEYYNTAYTVVGTLQERENQFRVVPRYLLEISPSQLRMTTTLRCLYTGTGKYQVVGNWSGWELDQVFQSLDGTLELVDAELTDGMMEFSVATSETDSRGDFELIIRSRKQLPSDSMNDSRHLDLLVPQIEVTSVENAKIVRGAQAIVLQPADNVEIIPDNEGMEGLLAGTLSDVEDLDIPDYQQTPLVLMSLPNLPQGEPLRVVGSVNVRQRSVLVTSTTSIQLESKYAAFEQELDYQIAYEPIRQITLTVPGIVRHPENLRVFLETDESGDDESGGNNVLPWSVVPNSMQADDERAQLEIEDITVDLLAEYSGSLRVILKYQEQLPLLMADASQRVNFLLVSPIARGVRLVQNEVTINTQEIFVSEPADGVWQVVRGVASEETSGDSLRLHASEATTSLPVQMRMRQDVTKTSTLVQRRWVQTALLNNQCRERLALTVRTNETDLHMQFPEQGVDASTLIVAINNQRVPVNQVVLDSDKQLTIRLAASNVESDYRVELWYMRTQFDPNRLRLPLPKVVNSKMSGSTYWQIVTTNEQHLLGTPHGWTPEYDWSWSGSYWFRSSALGQSELESWVGVGAQLALPENTNQYLLSTVGEVEELSAAITSRATLLFVISGLVLGIGLALLKFKILQQPAVVFIVGLIGGLAAVWVPEWMLLVLQSSFLGLLLVMIARILDWIITGPRTSAGTIHRSGAPADTNSAAIALLKLDSSMAAVENLDSLDDSQQQA